MDKEDTALADFRRLLASYGPLPDASFAALLPGVRVEEYGKDDYLLRHGEIATTRYFVHRGLVVSVYRTAGSIASGLLQQPTYLALRALEPTVVVAYDDWHYRDLMETDLALNRQYRRHLEQSWVIRNERRQLAFATETALERYRTFLREYPDLEQRVSQYHIASYLGITATQLSRV